MDFLSGVAEALRALREGRGLSQERLATLAGLDPSMLSRYERGARAPHLGTLSAILTALGLTLHDLADAIDEVAGRNPPQRSGRPETRLVAQIVARGGISGDYIDGLAAKSTATPEATADFVATVLAAATALAEQAIERARAEAAQAGEDPAQEGTPPPKAAKRP